MITEKTVTLENTPYLFAATILRRFAPNEVLFMEAMEAGNGSLNTAWDYVQVQSERYLNNSFAGIFGKVDDSVVLAYKADCYATKRYLEDLSSAIGGDIEHGEV